ncbi:MAG: PPOX class F420-dependent oxidoreductase [Actinobacteria bacterium]|nr:PPOX class F420-dependent oxidoreductase [Actinomycetota bacterium]
MATDLTPAQALDWAFAEPRTAKLATVTADGAPHVAPVWVARDGDRLVFNTGADTVKGRALARDPRVSICFDDERPPFSFVIVTGTAETTDDLDVVRRWAAVIGGRYMGAERAEEFGERNGVPGELLVTVTPTKVRGALAIAD